MFGVLGFTFFPLFSFPLLHFLSFSCFLVVIFIIRFPFPFPFHLHLHFLFD